MEIMRFTLIKLDMTGDCAESCFCAKHGCYASLGWCATCCAFHRICDWEENCRTMFEKSSKEKTKGEIDWR